jgi:hypothetical protein
MKEIRVDVWNGIPDAVFIPYDCKAKLVYHNEEPTTIRLKRKTMTKREQRLEDAITALLKCPNLNWDELEEVTLAAIRQANEAMEKENPEIDTYFP